MRCPVDLVMPMQPKPATALESFIKTQQNPTQFRTRNGPPALHSVPSGPKKTKECSEWPAVLKKNLVMRLYVETLVIQQMASVSYEIKVWQS